MSLGNEDNSITHQESSGDNNNNGTGTAASAGTEPVPLSTHVAGELPSNVNPSSTRTSVTRVENEEEARPRHSITNDLVATLTGTTTLAQGVTPNPTLQPSPVHEEERAASSQPTPESSDTKPLVAQQAGEPTEGTVPLTPQTYVTFLVISGKRRTLAFEPSTTIGRVKELAWNSWSEGMSV